MRSKIRAFMKNQQATPLHALAIALTLALAGGAALAEKADRAKPMNVEADSLKYDDLNQTSVFTGRVVVTKGSIVIRGAKVDVKQDPEGYQFGVVTAEPGKRAFFRQKRDNVDEYVEGYAQRAEFDDLNDMLKLYDKAKVKSAQNELTGNFISYDMTKELAQVTGAPPGQKAPEGSRVKVIIIPPKKDAQAGAGAAKPAPGVQLKPAESTGNR